jgi:hypothetical protein
MTDTVNRVIVLGAGASCSYTDSPTGLKPPIAKDLISTFFNLEISTNRYVLIGQIINYVRDTVGIAPVAFATWTDDIERLLTDIDEKFNNLSLLVRKRKLSPNELCNFFMLQGAYNQLIFLFASIFNEIQNGPISVPYSLLANELSEHDTCITFNWDTLMDCALFSTGNWDIINGYSLIPVAIFDDGWKIPQKNFIKRKGPKYLKLHGSINWLTPYSFVNASSGKITSLSSYSLNKFFVFYRATKPYRTYENRYWGPYQPFSYCYYPPNLPVVRDDTPPNHVNLRILNAIDLPDHGKIQVDDKDVYAMPLIVPPVKNKRYLRYGKLFSILWEEAKKALEDCEEIYIIGYSFPSTDFVSKQLFKDAISKNKNLNHIIIINPSADKIRELLLKEFNIDKSKIISKMMRFDPLIEPISKIISPKL